MQDRCSVILRFYDSVNTLLGLYLYQMIENYSNLHENSNSTKHQVLENLWVFGRVESDY